MRGGVSMAREKSQTPKGTKYRITFDRGNGETLEMVLYADDKVAAFDKAYDSLLRGWRVRSIVEDGKQPPKASKSFDEVLRLTQEYLRKNPPSIYL
ncbi:MAG: hypothetical protein IIT64_10235 [Bacteroidaceae bacterium]|nr:hypothetical protein [Bacteroidaceae bacterium]